MQSAFMSYSGIQASSAWVMVCRCLLTDVGSTNGTFVNRAQLRPHKDTQIKANDVITLGGSSGAAFRLVALEPQSFPTAVDRACRCLEKSHADLASSGDVASDPSEDGKSLAQQHHEIVSQALSSKPDGAAWLKVACPSLYLAKTSADKLLNAFVPFVFDSPFFGWHPVQQTRVLVFAGIFQPKLTLDGKQMMLSLMLHAGLQIARMEQRLAKLQSGGSFSRARTYYRAAVHCLEAESVGAGADFSPSAAEPLASTDLTLEVAEMDGAAGEVQIQQTSDGAAEHECGGSLVRALRSWGRMEGQLG